MILFAFIFITVHAETQADKQSQPVKDKREKLEFNR